MDAQGKFYKMAHECPCGSGLICEWCRDEKGAEIRACERCKPDLLHRIFDERYLDIFEEWWATILMDPPPLGYEWQWEDLLKEKGCKQVVGLAEANRRRTSDHIVIPCPNGYSLAPEHRDSEDSSVRILVPRDYADRVLAAGRMV